MTIREEAMMILSACAAEWNQTSTDFACMDLGLRGGACNLAFEAFCATWNLGHASMYLRYAEAEAMLACGRTP